MCWCYLANSMKLGASVPCYLEDSMFWVSDRYPVQHGKGHIGDHGLLHGNAWYSSVTPDRRRRRNGRSTCCAWAKRKETSLICAFTREMRLGHSLVPRSSHRPVLDYLRTCGKAWERGYLGHGLTKGDRWRWRNERSVIHDGWRRWGWRNHRGIRNVTRIRWSQLRLRDLFCFLHCALHGFNLLL